MANNEEYLTPESEEKDALDIMMRDRKTSRIIRSFMKRSNEYRKPHIELAKRSRRLYNNWDTTTATTKVKRANLKPSYGFMVIETLLPQICDVFFGDQQILNVEGWEEQDVQWEKPLTDFIGKQTNKMQLEFKSIVGFKNMLLDGTYIAKTPYRYEEKLGIKRNTEVDPETGTTFSNKEFVVNVLFDGPDVDVIEIIDFFPDWRVKEPGNIQKMRGCVHRMWRNMSDLERLEKRTQDGVTVGIYKNLDDVERSITRKGLHAWGPPHWSSEYDVNFDKENDNKDHIKNQDSVEIWEYWGLFEVEGELREMVITIANGDTIIRFDENFYDLQFKPFVAVPNYPRPGEFFGIPELLTIESEIREARTIRNARLDQINLSVNSMWLVDRTAGIDTRNLFSRAGGIVLTNDMNGVEPIKVGDPSPSSAQEIGFIENNIAQTTAIGSPPQAGNTKSALRSATGVQFVQQFASSRLGLKAKIISAMYFKPLYKIMMMTNRQFVTDTQWVRSSDPNSPNPFSQLPSDTFFREYDFIVNTKYEKSDQEQMERLQAASQILQVAEQTQPGTVKFDVLLEAMLRPLVGPAVKRFVRTPDELREMQVEKAALNVQEQQANAIIGQEAPQPNSGGGSTSGQ